MTSIINNISHSKYTNNLKKSAPPLHTISDMRTKGQCKLSEKELIAKVKELARKDAAVGRNSFLEPITSEWRKLRDDYISFASPDRAGIIQKSCHS